MQHTSINNATRKRQHQFAVGNAAEVVSEIGIYNVRMTTVKTLLHLLRCLLGIAARPVGMLLEGKIGFKDRFEHQHRCCHAHPIP